MRSKGIKLLSIILCVALILSVNGEYIFAAQTDNEMLPMQDEAQTDEPIEEIIEQPVTQEPSENGSQEEEPAKEDPIEEKPVENKKDDTNSEDTSSGDDGVIEEIIENTDEIDDSNVSDEMTEENTEDTDIDSVSEDDADLQIRVLSAAESGISDFPESYQKKLIKIYDTHSNWKFERVDVGLEWDTVVKNEMEDGRSLIEASANSKYVGAPYPKYSGWNYATKAGVEYYLDPRNYLDETHVFAFEALKYNSAYQTENAVKKMVTSNDSFMKGNLPDDSSKTYSNVIYSLGKDNKTNPLYLVARIFQEQGYKGTALTNGSKGYYNFFNIKGAYSSELAYAKAANWTTSYKALKDGINFIYTGYISAGQDTLYTQKWDIVGPTYYNHQYMQNIRAPYNEAVKLFGSYNGASALKNDYVFKIPVYRNMPDAPDTDKDSEKKDTPTEIELTQVTGIYFNEAEISLKPGEVKRLVVNTNPKNVTPEPIISWSSDNNAVAVVDSDGNVSAKGSGTAKIKAILQSNTNIYAECSISVGKVTITYRDLEGKVLKTIDSAKLGSPLSEYPYQEGKVFPDVEVTEGYELSGFYTDKDRKGVRVTEDTIISGDMDIYPYLIDINKGFEVKPVGDFYYTGNLIKPAVEVYNKDILLIQGKDYTLSYFDNRYANVDKDGNSIQSGLKPTIVIKGRGNYTGEEQLLFNIRQVDINETQAEDILLVYNKKLKPQYGKPAVYLGTQKLVLNRDYTLEYPDADGNSSSGTKNYGAYIAAGVYPVTIKGEGSIVGTKTVNEIITKKISVSKIKVLRRALNYYTLPKETIDADYLVKNGYINPTYKGSALRMLDESTMKVDSEDWDYRLEVPADMKTPGTKIIKLYGNKRNGYYGTLRISFVVKGSITLSSTTGYDGSITVTDASDSENIKHFTQEFDKIPTYSYQMGGVKPSVVVTLADGKVLKSGKDYTVTYKFYNSTEALSGRTSYVIIRGKGYYKGTVSYAYRILPKDIAGLGMMINDPVYSEKPGKALAKVSIFDTNKKTLKSGVDFSKNIIYTNAETGAVISKTEVIPAGTRVSVSVNGINNFTGSIGGEYVVKQASISKASVRVASKTFTGKDITLTMDDLYVYLDGAEVSKDNYEILSRTYYNNVNKGTASVYIRGKGNDYGGVKKVSFKITALPIVWYYNK